jgi:hypothetical protein
MAVDDELKKRIHSEIERATVKIFVYNEFQGTGFFITPDGYLLTAYHCLDQYGFADNIIIKTNFGKEFKAQFEEGKSSKFFDIAVLKVDGNISISLPLGVVSKEHVFDDIVALGYPAGHRDDNQQIGIYPGKISKFRDDFKIENNAIKGPGQSGGPVYHYPTKRIIGVAVEGYKSEVMTDTALAARLEPLFDKWPELEHKSDEVAKSWNQRLNKLIPKPNKELKKPQRQTIVKQTIHNEGANIGTQPIIGDVNTLNMTFGSNKN